MKRAPLFGLFAGLGLLLFTPIALASSGFASGFGPGCHFGPPTTQEEASQGAVRMVGFFSDRIDATEEQTDILEGIASEKAVTLFELHQQGQTLRDEMHEAVSAGADRSELEELRLNLISLIDQGSSELLDAMVDVRETLTDEQKAEMARMHEERSQRGPWRRGLRGPHGPPWAR